MNKTKLFDLAERAGWTAAQAVLGVVTVEALDIPLAWAPIVAVGLSMAKSFVAGRLGNTESVSTLPAELDPATPEAQRAA